jgi:hypothetical protein
MDYCSVEIVVENLDVDFGSGYWEIAVVGSWDFDI